MKPTVGQNSYHMACAMICICMCGCQEDERNQTATATDNHQAQTEKLPLAAETEAVDSHPVAIADEPVHATMRLSNPAAVSGDPIRLFIDVRIAPGWHVYAVDGDQGPFAPTVFELQLPAGLELAGEWTAPEAQPHSESGTAASVYRGNVTFRADLKRLESFRVNNQTIQCRLEYQVCNRFRCLPTATQDLTITLNGPTPETPEN